MSSPTVSSASGSSSTPGSELFRIRLGGDAGGSHDIRVPFLAGERDESLFPEAQALPSAGDVHLAAWGSWRLGRMSRPIVADLEQTTMRAYMDLFRATAGHALVRIWNYVPAINAVPADGLENYRAFCRGRSLAFEQAFGERFAAAACAASAVGSEGRTLDLVFAAVAGPVRHTENPRQVPAYEYPSEHGPRAPTFARASSVDLGGDEHAVFLSGTSAIRGHVSVAPDDTATQLECTLENLDGIARACGLGRRTASGVERHVKVYLRHAADFGAVARRLQETFLRAEDRVSYLRADICRRELNIEIEVSLPRVRLG